MKTNIRIIFLSALFFCAFFIQSCAQIDVIPDKADGVYTTGETVTWTIKANGKKKLDSLRYQVKSGGLIIADKGPVHLKGNRATIQYTFDAPGSVLLKVYWGKEDDFYSSATGGAVADTDQFQLSSSRPDDFKSFWADKISELEAVPVNARLEKGAAEVPGVDYYEIAMDNIRGSQIRGQLARPTEGDKFPALLIVQWAGIYPLEKGWAEDRAKEGWLVLNISAHDLPILEERSYYMEKAKGDLKNYSAIGNDDKETSYFLRMYLSCYRAADYLAQRPDWNGETLVVTGDSQGGLQAIMTAGFYPGITACVALVPAGFDHLGPEIGRKGGWPQWYYSTENKDPEKVHEASRYYDVSHFVPDIKCPVLVGVGLLDETCPPEGILAGLNQLKGPKEVMLLPRSAHQNQNGGQVPYQDRRDKTWFPALRSGKAMPE